MKLMLARILLAAFIATGVFGIFFIAATPMMTADAYCMSEMIKGFACNSTEAVSHASFHLDAASMFSTVIFNAMSLFLLALIVLCLLAFAVLLSKYSPLFTLIRAEIRRSLLARKRSFSPFLSWLSIHENSPAF